MAKSAWQAPVNVPGAAARLTVVGNITVTVDVKVEVAGSTVIYRALAELQFEYKPDHRRKLLSE